MLRHVKNARSAARRASQLTDQLLSFARRSDIEPRAVNLTGLIDELDEVLRHAAGPEIRRSVDIPAETWAVRADPDQLHATLLNLALNARDAMPEGGTLSISARNVATGTPRPEQLPPGDFVVIAMADTGCGMTGAVLRQATDPFFTTKPRGKGTGLGLAIAQSFAEQSHGLLHITSTPGEGTTIEVFLPSEGLLREPQAAGTPAMPDSADGELVVLCVDDTRQSAEVTADLLRDVGFNAICTTDPEAALGFARSNERLDLLVTDIDMPGLDGFGLAEQLRACFPGLAVLFITGHDEHVFVPRLQNGRLPLPHFLRKPFSGTELAAKIAQMRITVILQPRARRDLEHAG